MPNWCSNVLLLITDEKQDLIDFTDEMNKDDESFSLNKIMPTPPELLEVGAPTQTFSTQEECDEYNERFKSSYDDGIKYRAITEDRDAALKTRFGASNWYDWNTQNRSTKWNASVAICEDDITEYHHFSEYGEFALEIKFETAWAPPEPITKAISEGWPFTAVIVYCEAGMGFCGYTAYHAGFKKEEEYQEGIGEYKALSAALHTGLMTMEGG